MYLTSGDELRVDWLNEFHESRRCSRDTYPCSYTTKYTSKRRFKIFALNPRAPAPPLWGCFLWSLIIRDLSFWVYLSTVTRSYGAENLRWTVKDSQVGHEIWESCRILGTKIETENPVLPVMTVLSWHESWKASYFFECKSESNLLESMTGSDGLGVLHIAYRDSISFTGFSAWPVSFR